MHEVYVKKTADDAAKLFHVADIPASADKTIDLWDQAHQAYPTDSD
jgi:hypothetical protein